MLEANGLGRARPPDLSGIQRLRYLVDSLGAFLDRNRRAGTTTALRRLGSGVLLIRGNHRLAHEDHKAGLESVSLGFLDRRIGFSPSPIAFDTDAIYEILRTARSAIDEARVLQDEADRLLALLAEEQRKRKNLERRNDHLREAGLRWRRIAKALWRRYRRKRSADS